MRRETATSPYELLAIGDAIRLVTIAALSWQKRNGRPAISDGQPEIEFRFLLPEPLARAYADLYEGSNCVVTTVLVQRAKGTPLVWLVVRATAP